MSTGTRIPRTLAYTGAHRFMELFAGTFEAWTFAGSLRRGCESVGDIEHVVIPKLVPEVEESLMGPVATGLMTNRLLDRADELVRSGVVQKAEYGDTRTNRWGDKYRGILFEGIKHEIFTADERNHGAILAIRTGPHEFSEYLVTMLKQAGRYRQAGGYVRKVIDGDVCMLDDAIVPVPEEADYFKLVGVPLIEPHKREGWMP